MKTNLAAPPAARTHQQARRLLGGAPRDTDVRHVTVVRAPCAFAQLSPGTKHVLQWRAYLAVALLTAAAGSRVASAGDEALYGPVAPPGSAFVRVFNASPQDRLVGRVADKTLSDIEAFSASEFVFLPAGEYPLSIGDKSQPVNLKQDRFYTAVATGKGIQMFDNDGKANRLKALIILFNLTDRPVSLRTAEGAAVIDETAPGQSSSRAVNAVKTRLALFSGANKLSEVKPVTLERGKAFSLFVTPAGEQILPVWAVTPEEEP